MSRYLKTTRLAAAIAVIAAVVSVPVDASTPIKPGVEPGAEVSWTADAPLSPLGSAPNDLTLDTTFNDGSGAAFVDNPTSGGSHDLGLTVADAGNGRYWLIGSSNADDGVHVTPVVTVFAPDGTPGDPAFYASNTTLSALSTINAAVEGVNNGTRRIYLVGVYHFPGNTDADFGVLCLDPANAFVGCAGFGTGGLRAFYFDRGGSNNDVPTAITYDDESGDIYVAGSVDTGNGNAVGVVRLNGATGAPDVEWGNAPTSDGSFVYSTGWVSGGSSYPLAITVGSPQLFEHDVFVAGTADANSAGTDTDGFVLPIDAVNGTGFDPAWHNGTALRIFFDIGQTLKLDSIRALALRHNGDLLVAGNANGDNGLSHLILGEYDPVGHARTDFCLGAGVCQGPLETQPVVQAVAERRGAGDIVISASNVVSGVPVQGVYQIDPHGERLVAENTISWTASSGNGTAFSRGMMIDSQNRVLLAGTRVWDATSQDDDMTIGRFVATDSIFADCFGGGWKD